MEERPMDALRKKILEVTDIPNLYIDPPASLKMNYPCIRISRSSGYTQFANNMPYRHTISYDVKLIDYDPDSKYYKPLVMGLPMIRFNRHYVADDLHHDSFILYY